MNCKRIQELIVTDYLDGEAPGSLRAKIESHVSACAGCRAFEQSVRRNEDLLSRNFHPVQPPEEVWRNVRAAVSAEDTAEAPVFLERVLDLIRGSFFVRQPAYAFATVFTVLLVAVVVLGSPLRRQMLVKDYLSQKSAFMVALNSPPNGELDKVADFGTAIEQYLF
jgi:predicted anti-sigma-YlaC factor YlaD